MVSVRRVELLTVAYLCLFLAVCRRRLAVVYVRVTSEAGTGSTYEFTGGEFDRRSRGALSRVEGCENTGFLERTVQLDESDKDPPSESQGQKNNDLQSVQKMRGSTGSRRSGTGGGSQNL